MTAAKTSARYSQKPAASNHPPPSSHSMAAPPLLSPKTARSPQSSNHARTPSPNYFGFTVDESYDSETARHTRKHWSPPSSAVRSTAAFSPTVVPADQNPDFDAFRRQSESMVFNLGSLHNFKQNHEISPTSKAPLEPRSMAPPPQPPSTTSGNMHLDPDSAYLHRSPNKRHLSNDSAAYSDAPRRQSPASFLKQPPTPSRSLSQPRFSMPFDTKLPPPPQASSKPRADTVPFVGPPSNQGQAQGSGSFVTPQHLCNLLNSSAEEILILDLRVSTQYAASRLRGALNLCIPTTLLKRPSFNVNKLAETFKDSPEQRTRFENWKNSKYIVVYDTSSSQLKDATSCVNTINKFDSEGYEGTSYILKGGLAEFAKQFPSHLEKPSQSSSGGAHNLSLDGPEIAPVIGGCPMPVTKNAANPFFGNIRQNMDLIGGVGQMPVKQPANLSRYIQDRLPDWLREASEEKDKGARVSEKFLQIEKREQKRMQEALSGTVSYGTPSQSMPMPKSKIQIAGIEKGSKNRYNNIWPFEHTRVKLQDVPSHGCDYFNANHITSGRTNKHYIATQGPIPATFSDFWNVVWQQDVRVIVMLTAEKEGGQVKAHNYWNDNQYGPMRLEFLSEKRASLDPEKIKRHRQRPSAGARKSTDGAPLARLDTASTKDVSASDQPFVIVRKLALSHEGHPFERMREVTQLQYSSWPDFGAPAHPAHLLGLVEQCDAVVRTTTKQTLSDPDPPDARPILVHCSAGCGRTGTFCTVASVIDMLKRQRTSRHRTRESSPMHLDRRSSARMDDNSPFFAASNPSATEEDDVNGRWLRGDDQDLIEKTVEDFRRQRLSMVQSLRQFVLCYESVLEWLVEQENED